jgi:hypothetical protein
MTHLPFCGTFQMTPSADLPARAIWRTFAQVLAFKNYCNPGILDKTALYTKEGERKMAQIEFRINLDGNGNLTIVPTIERLDPGDRIHLVTDTPNAALRWNGDSPFLPPAADNVLLLTPASGPRQALEIARPTDMSQSLAQCGEKREDGSFSVWPQLKSGFPRVPDNQMPN